MRCCKKNLGHQYRKILCVDIRLEETRLTLLWFNFILGLNFIFLCFKLVIIHYHTQKQKKIKFKPRIKLNHNNAMFSEDVAQI